MTNKKAKVKDDLMFEVFLGFVWWVLLCVGLEKVKRLLVLF